MIPIYSISKPFLAQAVLELGLPLESPIGKFIPSLPSTYATRPLYKLLNHSSGLGSYGELADYQTSVDSGLSAWEPEQLLSRCENLTHNHVGFAYSNLGYLLLRMLLEKELQTSYFAGIKQLVLEPLSIDCFAEWETSTSIVPGYDPKWVYSGTFLGDQDQIAPAVSKLALHRAKTSSLSAGLIPVAVDDSGFDLPGYNFGFMTDGGTAERPPKFVGHGGSGPGYELMVLIDTSNGKGAIEVTASGFIQSEAITRLKNELQTTGD